MPTHVLLCDSPNELALVHYTMLSTVADLDVAMASDGFRAAELASRIQPDVIIVEPAIQGLSGVDLIRRLGATAPESRIICWSTVASPDAAAEILNEGARGYLLKGDGPEEVARALGPVLQGGIVLSPAIAAALIRRYAQALRRDRELQEAFSDASVRLEQVTQAKAEFLANVSHELRTPVTIAKGIAYVLQRQGIEGEDRKEFLGQLEGSLDKLMSLIDGLITIAEMEQGTLTLDVSEVDLAPILHQMCDEVAVEYPGVTIERDIPEVLPSMADPERIPDVARQLLDNACRYTPEDQPVSIRARSMEEGVVVGITDRGEGVHRDVIAQAFREPFTAGEEILRKERSGIGLGLHIARKLVLQHGGIMWADPLPAGGTKVSFCIPTQSSGPVTHLPADSADPPAQSSDSMASP